MRCSTCAQVGGNCAPAADVAANVQLIYSPSSSFAALLSSATVLLCCSEWLLKAPPNSCPTCVICSFRFCFRGIFLGGHVSNLLLTGTLCILGRGCPEERLQDIAHSEVGALFFGSTLPEEEAPFGLPLLLENGQ